MALARAQKKKEELEKKKKQQSGEEVNLKFLRSGDATNYPLKGDSVSVHYRGYLSDGTKFDDSYERGQPLFFVVGAGHVIPGWDMIMPLLSLRSIAQIECPPEVRTTFLSPFHSISSSLFCYVLLH